TALLPSHRRGCRGATRRNAAHGHPDPCGQAAAGPPGRASRSEVRGGRMSPLEHRYRRLLRLLPEQHRAARGEELLGLLLDFDEGRSRPSTRQALGVLGLAIRLRLGGLPSAVLFLFGAFLVAYSSMPVGQLIDDYTGAFRPVDLPLLRHATPILL